ncbi:MAG: F0F1-type synthase subunit a, partial [Planctomycetota bacterium]|jgi:F-type H+-transporting ATPase subunit a
LLVKPFALTIRLFANMLAGHLVIASFIGLIFLFAKMQGGAVTSYLTAVPAVGMAVFIFIIESFVTLLQAYIFTYLSIIFLQQAMHPEH